MRFSSIAMKPRSAVIKFSLIRYIVFLKIVFYIAMDSY
nr:MAG TPA: hypothetical protein [Caudoviricetes sp.]